jgi:hypothetical protein
LSLQEIAFKIINKKDFDRSKTQLLKSKNVNLNSLDPLYLQLLFRSQEVNLENIIEVEQSEFAWTDHKSEMKELNFYFDLVHLLFLFSFWINC